MTNEIKGRIIYLKSNWEALHRWGDMEITLKTESMDYNDLMVLTAKIKKIMLKYGKGIVTVEEGNRFAKFTEKEK